MERRSKRTSSPSLGRQEAWTSSSTRRGRARAYANGKLAVDVPLDEFMVPVETVLKAQFLTARAAARQMLKQGSGVIIFLTGSPSRPHDPGISGLGAAFGAVENLTRHMAIELSPAGVRVVCLRTSANPDSRT